jgi:CRP-like cAMP-binding protein
MLTPCPMGETLESSLASLSLFELLRPDEVARVAARFESRQLAPGEALGAPAESPRLLVLVDGSADLEVDLGHGVSRARLQAGDRWGDVHLVTGRPRSATLRARVTSTVATLDAKGLEELLDELPAIALPFARELASHLRVENDERRQLLELHAEGLAADQLAAAVEERRTAVAARGARVSRVGPRALFHRLVVREGAEPPFWMLAGFLAALGGARLVVALILKYGLEKRLFALVQGNDPNPMHVHHFNYGLVVASVSGLAALFPFGRRALRLLAAAFGVGLGLIFDEFALLWNLNPEYAQSLSLISATLVAVVLLQLVYFRRFWGAVGRRLLYRARRPS